MNDIVGGIGPTTLPDAVLDWENEGGHSVSAGRRRSGSLGKSPALITAAPKNEADLPDHADCMACDHSPDTHDKIALRFCNATVERALTRGCICRTQAPA